MKLSECKIGVVVTAKGCSWVGHVKGFTMSAFDDDLVLVEVQWANMDCLDVIQPEYLELYEG